MANSTKPHPPRANSRAQRFTAVDIDQLLDRPIAFHRIFAHAGGGTREGLFLSQAVYWSPRASNPDGWFYKTQADWWEETGLTRYEQETVRRNLRATGILVEKRMGQSGHIYFKIDFERLAQVLRDIIDNRKQSQPEMGKSNISKRGKATAGNAKKQQRTETETTAEISSETTAVVAALVSLGVDETVAQTLVDNFPQQAAQQVAWFPQRPTPDKPAAWIIRAIERGYAAPRARRARASAPPAASPTHAPWKPPTPQPEASEESTVEFDRTFAKLSKKKLDALRLEMLEAFPIMRAKHERGETLDFELKMFYRSKLEKS